MDIRKYITKKNVIIGAVAGTAVIGGIVALAINHHKKKKDKELEEFLCDEKNGDYDTKGIFYAVKPDGTRVDINRFFTESGGGWKEITKDEYEEMKTRKIK